MVDGGSARACVHDEVKRGSRHGDVVGCGVGANRWRLGLTKWAERLVAPFQLSNGYGLFRSMTGVGPSVLDSHGRVVSQVARPELILEVSMGEDCTDSAAISDEKACQWLPFEFHYKPGNVARAPAWVAPHLPRLDWQMWFAALSYDWQSTAWFPTMLQGLCRRAHPVVDLLGHHGIPFAPFGKGAGPNFIRVRKLLYDFTVRYETTAVMYEAPKGERTDLQRTCSKLATASACDEARRHCQVSLSTGKCENRVSISHKLVKEQSPDWWTRHSATAFTPVMAFDEFKTKGYLPSGNSLPNMPITFGGKFVHERKLLAHHCAKACERYTECVAFTYLPSRGACYLKSVAAPARGVDCEKDCWHYGIVESHLQIKHAYLPLDSRLSFLKIAGVVTLILLLAQAPIFTGIDWTSLTAEAERRVYLRQATMLATWVALLGVIIWAVHYTAKHLGQVFIPYILGAGAGMMLSCYLFHVETNLEQSPQYKPSLDLNSRINSSKPAVAKHARIFGGTQNSLYGILYNIVLIVLSLIFEVLPDQYAILLTILALTGLGVLFSLYQLYISFVVECVACPVRVGICVINVALLWLTLYITEMQRAFLEYDSFFLDAMAHATKSTHGD